MDSEDNSVKLTPADVKNLESEENLLQSEAVTEDKPEAKVEAQAPPQQQPEQPVQAPVAPVVQSQQIQEQPQPLVLFKSSDIPIDQRVTEFLTKMMEGNPFNKYCIDCKKKKTSHFLVQYGTFVCQDCANQHSQMNQYAQSKLQIKHVLHEHWDDFQLKSAQVGGNRPLFDILKEFDISDLDIPHKYRHAALKWFRRRHGAKCDGMDMQFIEPKPAKNMDERLKNTQVLLRKNLDELNPKIQELENKSVDFSIKVDNTLSELGSKIKASKFGRSFTKQFNKITKRDTNDRRPSMEGSNDANGQSFPGEGQALGSSTGETEPAFDEQHSLSGMRKKRDSDASVDVQPVYDEAAKEEPKAEDQT